MRRLFLFWKLRTTCSRKPTSTEELKKAPKEEIAFAQNHFAVQTHRAEMVKQRILEFERVKAREKISQTEKQLSRILYERAVDSQGFAINKPTKIFKEPN